MKLLFISLILILSTNICALNKTETYNYSLKTIYSTMIRFLVIEEDAEIIQKDIEGAYIKFKSKSKEISGIIEIIKINDKKTKLNLNFEGAHYKLILFFKNFNKKLKSEQDSINKKE